MQATMKTKKILPLIKGTSRRRKTAYLLGRRTKHLLGKFSLYYTCCPRFYHAIVSVLSQEISDTSDNDYFEIGDDSTPTRLRNAKRKRPRSRSKSITPPPVLSAFQIQNAKRIVRCAFSPFFSVTSHSHQSSYHLEKH
jgi:hypothetical protein